MLFAGMMSSSSLMAFDSFTVKKIHIEGNQRISTEAVLQDIPIAIGELLTTDKSSETIHLLYKTGFYKNVVLERDGSTLIVKVVERPSIGKLELTGLKSKDDVNKILKDNNVAEGRMYDPVIINKVEKEIIQKYLTQQRYGVRVETKVTDQDRNRVALEIHVYEGDIATIREIRFSGNRAYSDKVLRKQMFHKTTNILSWFDKSDHYSKEKLAADLEMLRSFYMDRGYINFRIESTQVSLSVDKKYVYFTINLFEGDQFFFKQPVLAGELVVDKSELNKIIDKHIKAGAVFSRKAIWETKEELEERLGEAGYSKANVRIVDDIDVESRLVGIKFYVDPFKRIIVRKIHFTGNTLTEDKVLRRGSEQFEGSWISTKKVKESKETIMRDGFASNVEIQTVPVVDKDDQVDLVYKIEEQRNAQLSAGLSYSDAEKLSFNLGADLKNFIGTGKDVNLTFNYGKSVQTYNFGYSNPYFTESGIGMTYNIYNQRTNWSRTSGVFDYALNTTGFNILWQYRFAQHSAFRYGGGYDLTVLKMNYTDAPIPAQTFANAYSAGKSPNSLPFKEWFINFGQVHNSLDTYLFPTKGISQNIDFKFSIPVADLRLYKIDFDLSWFKPVYDPFVLNLRIGSGWQHVYNGQPFPFYKNYYLGGGESVRGYKERSLGPQTTSEQPWGGNFKVEGRAQIIFPPPVAELNKSMRMALFLDAGQVYDTVNKSNSPGMLGNASGIRYSAGAAITWNTPMSIPISVSYAWPLNRKTGDSVKRFTFSFGTQL